MIRNVAFFCLIASAVQAQTMPEIDLPGVEESGIHCQLLVVPGYTFKAPFTATDSVTRKVLFHAEAGGTVRRKMCINAPFHHEMHISSPSASGAVSP